MQDILQQIQSLKEDFMNLIEVEGLGQPASDVPPTTNKIKKDRKTKNGKVELVSVEDELFPYEGNKREQYRQKILDTINGMIQGTATLEDLLQIVRQKKAPLKEAMEVLEELIGEDTFSNLEKQKEPIYKRAHKNALRNLKGKPELETYKRLRNSKNSEDRESMKGVGASKRDFENLMKINSLQQKAKNVQGEAQKQMGYPNRKTKNEIGDKKTEERRYDTYYPQATVISDGPEVPYHKGEMKGYPHYEEPKSDKQRVKDSIARHEKKEQKKAPLKEAMELMETALTAIRNSGLPKEKQQELTSKLAKGRAKERELADEKAFKSWAKGDRKQLDVQTVRDPEFTKNASGERKTRLRSHSNNYTKSGGRKIKPEWKQVEDSIKRHEKKAKLAEALSLMEAIINEISDKTANSFLEKRVINALDAWYNNDDLNKKEDDAVKALIKRKRRQGKELSDDEKKRIEEAVINELHPDTVNNALNKRIDQDIEADEKDRVNFNNILKIKDRDERAKAYKEFKKKYDERNAIIDKRMDRYEAYAKRHPEIIESVEKYTDNDGNTHELEFSVDKNKENKYKFDHRVNGKSIVSATDSEPNANYERKHAVKNYGLKKVEEALSLMEEIINEVSVGALARAAENSFNKRREIAKDSTEKAKKAYDNYEKQSKEHPEDEEALYKAVSKLSNVAHNDREKASHANDLINLNLPKDSKVSANKLFKAADKTYGSRGKEVDKALNKGKGKGDKEFDSSMKKYARAVELAVADPVVVRRTNETLEEALRILEGLFVNDGRGDLIDNDIMNKPGWTRKTIENGIVKVAKGCQKKVDNKEK